MMSQPIPTIRLMPPPDGDTIAEISLNGAQVTSMVDVIGKVGSGELPLASAIAILTTAFPIDDAQARKLLTGIVPGSQKPQEGEPA